MSLEIRYRRVLRRLGGVAGLSLLPENVKKILRDTTDLKTKTEILEAIAVALEK